MAKIDPAPPWSIVDRSQLLDHNFAAAQASADALLRNGPRVKVLAWLMAAAGAVLWLLLLGASDGQGQVLLVVKGIIIALFAGAGLVHVFALLTVGVGHTLNLLLDAARARVRAEQAKATTSS